MDALDLIAKIKMDLSEYEEGLDKAKSQASSSGSSISSAFGKVASGIGTAMSVATKVTATAITAGVTGVAALTTAAINSYAEYEQMEGGISKIFGTAGKTVEEYAESVGKSVSEVKSEYDSLQETESLVMENAANSWKTAGTSANEYMSTVTALSGALMSSLDYDKTAAAEYADRAITDMSDIANTYGYTMDQVSGIYTSVSRGLYQTIDTLTAGSFAGTKAGYQDLIDTMADATDIQDKLNITVEKGNYDYDNFVNAMSVYNEKMGIAGTTAREASTTISGSLSQMSAAWSNLLTGIADENANLDTLMQNLVDSIVGYTDEAGNHVNGFLDNIIPVIETSLNSIGTLVENLVPTFIEIIDNMLSGDLLDNLTSAAVNLVQGFVTAFSDNIDTITGVINTLITAIVDLIPDIISLGGQIVSTLASAIMDNLDSILDAAGQILEMILTGISENIDSIVTAATTIITKLAGFLTDNMDLIISSAVTIIMTLATALLDNLPTIVEAGLNLFVAIVEGLIQALPQIIEAIPDLVNGIINALLEMIPDLIEASTTLFMAMVEALPEIMEALNEAIPELVDSVVDWMSGDGMGEILSASLAMFSAIYQAIPQIAITVISGIVTLFGNVIVTIAGKAAELTSSALTAFGGILTGLTQKASEILSNLKAKLAEWVNAIKEKVNDWKSAGQNLITGLWSGISDKAQWLYSQITGLGSTVVSKVKSMFGINSPSKVFAEIGGYLAEGLGVGWENEIKDVNKQIEDDMNYDASLNVMSNLDNVVTTNTKGSTLTDQDISRIISGLQINFQNNTYIDGSKMKEEAYKYTVERTTNETRAVNVSQGGYF